MDINPFSFLSEHPEYPHARTLRTSVTQKIKDSVSVLTGHVAIDPSADSWFFQAANLEQVFEKVRLGIFDYLTLCIPYGVTWGLAKLLVAIQEQKRQHQDESDIPDKQTISSLLFQLAVDFAEYSVWLTLVLWNVLVHGLLRALVGGLGVFFLGLPISVFVDYVSHFYSHAIKKDAFTLQGFQALNDSAAGLILSYNSTINQDYEHQQGTVESVSLEDFLLHQKAAHAQSLFDMEQYTSKVVKLTNTDYLVIEHPSARLKFYAEINSDNREAIDALSKLNFAHVVDALKMLCADQRSSIASESWITKSHFFQALNPKNAMNATQTKTTFASYLQSVYPWS